MNKLQVFWVYILNSQYLILFVICYLFFILTIPLVAWLHLLVVTCIFCKSSNLPFSQPPVALAYHALLPFFAGDLQHAGCSLWWCFGSHIFGCWYLAAFIATARHSHLLRWALMFFMVLPLPNIWNMIQSKCFKGVVM